MSAWKLVEAIPEVAEQPVPNPQQATRESNGGERTRSNRSRRNHNPTGRSKHERSYFAYLAVQQIDAILHPDNLCMDTFLRSYMDVEGFVPIALVASYQNVSYFGCSYEDILHKLIQVEPKANYYELDQQNETIRPKTGWEMFRMPNGQGSFGLPKYIKQVNYVDTGAFTGAEQYPVDNSTSDGMVSGAPN